MKMGKLYLKREVEVVEEKVAFWLRKKELDRKGCMREKYRESWKRERLMTLIHLWI